MVDPVRSSRHGGLVHAELGALGCSVDAILDFSVNVNPYGPAPEMRAAISGAAIERYPDPRGAPARAALARFLDVEERRVVLGNGAAELLWLLPRALIRPGDAVLVVEPAFSEFRAGAVVAGAVVVSHETTARTGFSVDLSALDREVRAVRPRLVYLATPSNPAGVWTPLGAIAELASGHSGTTFIVDVSFATLSDHADAVARALPEHVVWVRSLTKDHALPGVRTGFALVPADLAPRLERERPPWSIGAPALAAVTSATELWAAPFLESSRKSLAVDRAETAALLSGLGFHPYPSTANFVLAGLPSERGPRSATALRGALLARHAILVRDATSFGLPDHVRVAARPAPDRARLRAAVEEELGR